ATEARAAGSDVDGIDRETDSAKHLKAARLRLLLGVVHDVAPVVRFRRFFCFKTCRCQSKTRSSRLCFVPLGEQDPSHAARSSSFKSSQLAFDSLTSAARTQSLHAVSSSLCLPSASVQRSRASRRDCSTARTAVTLVAALSTCFQTVGWRHHSDSGCTSTGSKRRAVESRNTAAKREGSTQTMSSSHSSAAQR